MSKIAIVTDSNSGITQTEAKELGIYVVPMPFLLNEETYYEDVNLSHDEFYQKLEEGLDISTSQPTPDSITGLWKELLQEYDEIVHIPMSSGLSGACQTAYVLAQKFEDKVHVVNNQRISVTQESSVLDALALAEAGLSGAAIREKLEAERFDASIYIMVDTLQYLKKGGRITPAAAALGTFLKLKPVLQIQGEKLDAFAKVRTVKQAKSVMIEAIQNDFKERFQEESASNQMRLYIVHSNNDEAAEEFRKELQELFPDKEIRIARLSLSVSCHIGPGSLAIACAKVNK